MRPTGKDGEREQIQVERVRSCTLCGAPGRPLYSALRDRLFYAPGEWGFKKCANPRCRLVWLDPRPVEDDIPKAYSSYYTHRSDDAPTSSPRPWFRRLLERARWGYLAGAFGYPQTGRGSAVLGQVMRLRPLRRGDLDFSVRYLPVSEGGRLLDIGCGDGRFLAFMQSLGWSCEGLDPDPVAVNRARRRSVDVRLGHFDASTYPRASFDAVTAAHVIEHVIDPTRFLANCKRVLKPGGRLVIVTPNSESLGSRLFGSAWLHWDPPRHLHVFNRPLLTQVAEVAGLRGCDTRTTGREANGVFLASQSIRHYGRYEESTPRSRTSRFWTGALQLAEWAALQARPDLGEEIVLVCKTGE